MNIFIKILNFLLTYSSGTFIIFCLLLFFIIFVLNFLVADPKSVSFIWQYFASFVYSCNQTFFLSVHDFSFFIFMPASMKKSKAPICEQAPCNCSGPWKSLNPSCKADTLLMVESENFENVLPWKKKKMLIS